MNLDALHVQAQLLLYVALLKQSLDGVQRVLAQMGTMLAIVSRIIVHLSSGCCIEYALEVNFLAAKLPIVEVGPEVLLEDDRNPRSDVMESLRIEPLRRLNLNIMQLDRMLSTGRVAVLLVLALELARKRERIAIGCALHDVKEVFCVGHKLRRYRNCVEIHEQICQLDVQAECVEGFLPFRVVSFKHLQLVLALRPRVELVLELHVHAAGVRRGANHGALTLLRVPLHWRLEVQLVVHMAAEAGAKLAAHLVRIDDVVSAHEVLLAVPGASVRHRWLEYGLVEGKGRLHSEARVVQLLYGLLAQQILMVAGGGDLLGVRPLLQLLRRLRSE